MVNSTAFCSIDFTDRSTMLALGDGSSSLGCWVWVWLNNILLLGSFMMELFKEKCCCHSKILFSWLYFHYQKVPTRSTLVHPGSYQLLWYFSQVRWTDFFFLFHRSLYHIFREQVIVKKKKNYCKKKKMLERDQIVCFQFWFPCSFSKWSLKWN
jgi:hypothetical protein